MRRLAYPVSAVSNAGNRTNFPAQRSGPSEGGVVHLVSFSVQNYRSITKAHRLGIAHSTVLIGPNNEGKSNILRAMVTALKIVSYVPAPDAVRAQVNRKLYEWTRDFPVPLQATKPNGESVFTLEFELTPEDVEEFWTEVRSRINGTLPVQVSVGRREPSIKIMKKGPGGPALSQKRDAIARFVARRIDIEYIQAVRTAESARDVVDALVSRELKTLEAKPEYQNAVAAIEALQTPVLQALSQSIKNTLSVFLPAIRDVEIQISTNERYRALRRSIEVLIDDGTRTDLELKGDGVQSLAALGLMRHLSESGTVRRNLLLAIEEPESHLHPKAIHELRGVLDELASRYSVVITTHCPLFVDRGDIKRNIVVAANRARPARAIDEVREVLGVRASDNLRNAQHVLLVEGTDDELALRALLQHNSPAVRDALRNGILAFEVLRGASTLSYIATLLRNQLCDVMCFLDSDQAGRQAAERALSDGVIAPRDLVYATVEGAAEAELEDLYEVAVYKDALARDFNVQIDDPQFRGNRKWSQRVARVFQRQGQIWDDAVEMRVKAAVAAAVADASVNALQVAKRGAFDSLVRALEVRLAGAGAERAAPPISPTGQAGAETG